MNEPERPINTFYGFCSLILPGLGQLLQKRIGTAIGFFTLFIVSGFLPVLIVSLLFRDRFTDQPLRVHLLHMFLFAGLFYLFMVAIFWSAVDAAWKPEEKKGSRTPPRLIDILVVIAIIGILVALLLPAVPAARESARRAQCVNNMKQIMLALNNYHDEYGQFPPTYTVDENDNPLHSWRVLILPYIEQGTLYKEIHLDEPWDSEHNRQFHSEAPTVFRCPSGSPREVDPVPAPAGSFYSVIDGSEAAFFGSQTRSMTDVEKPDETIFLVERRIPVNWMDPSREISFETASKGINVDAMGISSYHTEGAYVALGDGSVHFLKNTTLHKMLMLNKKSVM